MPSKFRQPLPWEPQLQEREVEHDFAPPVALPPWATRGTGGEHPNARRAMNNIARRYMDQARENGVSDYSYETALEEGRRAAYRHDEKN